MTRFTSRMRVRPLRVSDDGEIRLPFVGQVKVVGLSEQTAEDVIEKAYRDASLIEHAMINVLKLRADSTGPRQ